MIAVLKTIYRYLISFGIDPILTYKGIKNISFYIKDFLKIKKNKSFPMHANYPCLHDKYDNGGTDSGHYFHQDLLIASKIYQDNPDKHVDIGSRIDGFIAHLACFRKIEVFDIRNIKSKVDNIIFKQGDLMNLNESLINYTSSISCLHVIEHFGLGRYGDTVNINGHIDGLNNIYKILKKGGKFYFSVPIGPQRIEFNAHRVFSIKYLLDFFDGKYELISFSFVDDKGDLHQNIKLTEDKIRNNCGTYYGCGIFELLKI